MPRVPPTRRASKPWKWPTTNKIHALEARSRPRPSGGVFSFAGQRPLRFRALNPSRRYTSPSDPRPVPSFGGTPQATTLSLRTLHVRSDHERRVSRGPPGYRFRAFPGSARGRGCPPDSGDVTSFLQDPAGSPHRQSNRRRVRDFTHHVGVRGACRAHTLRPSHRARNQGEVAALSPERPTGWRLVCVCATLIFCSDLATIKRAVQPEDAIPRSGDAASVGCACTRSSLFICLA